MIEKDIIDAIFSIYNRYWSIMQWWASVSFGFIAVAHFSADKLNIYLITLLILLYSLFTGWIGLDYLFNVQILAGFNADLVDLGAMAHHGSQALIGSNLVYLAVVLQDAAIVLTYIGSVAYLVYSYRSRR